MARTGVLNVLSLLMEINFLRKAIAHPLVSAAAEKILWLQELHERKRSKKVGEDGGRRGG